MSEHILQSSTNTEVQTALFKRLLAFFHENSLEYCLVGNTDNLNDMITSDIDIVVRHENLQKTLNLLFNFNNASLVQIIQHEQNAYYTVLAATCKKNTQPVFLHPDVASDFYRNGRLFLMAGEILNNRLPPDETRDFYTPEPATEFIYYLLKRIDKLWLDNTHSKHLERVYKKDPEGAKRRLRRFWPPQEADFLIEAIENNDWLLIERQVKYFQKALRLPSVSGFHWFLETMRKLQRFLKPSGFWIAFMGPDGCGKSSVSERVEQQLAPLFRQTIWMHLHPRLGQTVSRAGSVSHINPHGLKPRGLLFSTLKQAYFLLDYIVGYFVRVRPALVRSTFVLFDRYMADLNVDPKRFRFSGPPWLIGLLGFMVPEPDMYILLDAPAEILQGRKQEVSPAETARQRQAYLSWAESSSGCHIVDASQSLEEVVAEVNRLVLSTMARRIRNRFAHG